jgi:hypothetical protein
MVWMLVVVLALGFGPATQGDTPVPAGLSASEPSAPQATGEGVVVTPGEERPATPTPAPNAAGTPTGKRAKPRKHTLRGYFVAADVAAGRLTARLKPCAHASCTRPPGPELEELTLPVEGRARGRLKKLKPSSDILILTCREDDQGRPVAIVDIYSWTRGQETWNGIVEGAAAVIFMVEIVKEVVRAVR